MFERYTENARRTVFFARYEASQFSGSCIETEHLLLGMLREDATLANRFLPSPEAIESIRRDVEQRTTPGEKVATSVDMPLSHESKRVLAYAAEEAQRLNHKHIGTEHLLIGLLREEKCLAAELLRAQGVTLHSVRERLRRSDPSLTQAQSAAFSRLDQWLTHREARGDISTLRQKSLANRTIHFAIYAVAQATAPAEELADLQKRIDSIVAAMEQAIAAHEFEKARSYSEEERKERERLRQLREQSNLPEPPPRLPLLCIEIIRNERFADIQERCDDLIAEGIPEIWLLAPELKRAYIAAPPEGLREFKGGVLNLTNPPLELDLKTIFD